MRRLLRVFSDLPIARKLFLASFIPVLTVILLSIVTYRSVETFSEDEGELNNIYLSQRLAAEYLRLIVDLETGFRGFVITRQDKYLYPYRTAQDHVQAVGLSLEEKVREYGEQRLIIAKVQSLAAQFVMEKEDLIEAVKSGRPEDARRYIEDGRGRTIMLLIREEMSRFDHTGQTILNARLARLSQDRNTMLFVILGGGFVALGLMLFTLNLIARSITGPLVSLAKAVGSSPAALIPTIPVTMRKDEIGNLTQVIHTMSTQLREHLAAVEKSEAEQRILNQDLSVSELKYRSLVDHAPFGIFSTTGFKITFSNRYNRTLAGLSPDDESDPESFRQWIHPDDRDRVLTAFAKAVEERRPYETVFRFLHHDGTVRKVLSRRIPIQQEDGQPVVYQGFNIDITALDQMQARLSRAERLATLGQVAAGIAHEIRNPLVGIGSNASLLLDEFDANDPRRSDLELILKETRRLDRIVNQIIDYARPREVAPALFNLAELIQESLKLLEGSIVAKRIAVHSGMVADPALMHADRDQLKQVLLNLIQNAVDALDHDGTITMTVGESIRNTETGIGVTVTDSGHGIRPEELPHVFEPFFTSGKHKGTGLGLAICRNIIEAHGGDIRLVSEVGRGTSASIWIPSIQQPRMREH
ncbi:putative Sensor histidine kinase [Nitrospira sp. KM1]|uniref:ATP-binding protein n=1 Tax=Nitrospira sp. KM1 TaxID=1936990 RepID=UPI0013A75706|nr:ATP-binding protein [Nitrospira sp. KM1]BCA56170.1 putative Sensor histidine kinase [Nitrospira sp. KM1]